MDTLTPTGPTVWRPDGRFEARIGSRRNLQVMNDQVLIPINFDILRSGNPRIQIIGSQSQAFSLWTFRSSDVCIKKPTHNVNLVTVHFVTSGQATLRCRDGDAVGTPMTAVMTSFDNLRDFQNSKAFDSIGGAFSVEALMTLNKALTGRDQLDLLTFSRTADLVTMGLRALFCTMRLVHRRGLEMSRPDDLVLGLLQETLGYQLLAAWPRDGGAPSHERRHARVDRLDLAKQFIAAHLATKITLSDIAGASGLSVRALQDGFRRAENLTPVAYLLHQRLQRVHADLVAGRHRELPIRAIAQQWGFAHAGDFARRYRAAFGCTPTETRRQAG